MKTGRKFVTALALFSIFFQSIVFPLSKTIVYAQEITVTPTEISSPTPSISPTAEITSSVSPTLTPEAFLTPQVTPTQDILDGVSIVATPEPTSPQSQPTEETKNNSPPTSGDGHIEAIILSNVSAPSLDLSTQESAGSASVSTDKADYAPTDTALITGSGFNPGETYILYITSNDEPAVNFKTQVTADENGSFAYAYQLDGNYRPNYKVEVKDSSGNIIATATFTDAGADLDQCGNGTLSSPDPTPCQSNTEWENGNLGASKSHYYEGDTVPYRMKMSGLSLASHTLAIEWDTTKSDKHAIDYVTSFDNTVAADPCAGVSGCSSSTTFAIPADPQVTGAGVTPIAGSFRLYGGTITSVSAYSYPDGTGFSGDKSAGISITFTASQSNPVLAWGGHIATRGDWGSTNSAVSISGSPYHMRNEGLDGSGGNQDRSLSAQAVIFPSSITIAKDAVPDNSQDFTYTSTGGLSPASFSLDDDGDSTLSNTQLFSNILVTASGGNSYTITEGIVSGWTVSFGIPVCAVTSANGGSQSGNVSTRTLSVNLREGENVSCTFTNTRQTGTVTVNKVLVPSNDPGLFNLKIDGTTYASNVGDSGTTGAQTVTTGAHVVSETAGTSTDLSNYTTVISGNCDTSGNVTVGSGESKTCTITNTRKTGSVKVNKLVDSNGDGTFEGGNTEANTLGFRWSLDGSGTNTMGSTVSGVNTGAHSVNENSVTDYHFVGWYLTSDISKTCSNTTNNTLPASISVSNGVTSEITLCNAINTGTIVVHKDVQGPTGQDIIDTSSNFTVQLDSANSKSITDNGTATYSGILVGSHTVTESVVATGYTLYGISETQGAAGNTGGLPVSVVSDQTTHVYVTNRQNTGTIVVVKDVLNPDSGTVSDTHPFTANVAPGDQSDTFSKGDNASFTVNPGTYTVTENDDLNYDEEGCKLATGADAANFSVAPGGEVTVTCINKQKKATINVEKNVRAPDGSNVSDNHAFTAQLNGGNDQSFSENSFTSYSVNPGRHSITELSDSNYDYVSCTPDDNQTAGDGAQVTIGSNGSITITCTNKQKNATVTIVKDVRDPNGDDVTDNTNFVVQRDGSGTEDKAFRENLNAVYTLAPETYTFTELVTAGYTLNSISGDNDADVSNGTTITLNSGESQTITFTNYQKFGSISGQKLNDGQTNLAGWTINLFKCAFDFTDCVLSETTTTDENGYSFLNVIPGFYQVREVLQTGWTNLTTLLQNLTVNPDEDITDVNFVNFKNVSVTACKVIDADGDIVTTNDQSNQYGWTVKLRTDEQATDTQTTGENGCYTWEDLGPNHTYGVEEDVPDGWTALTATSNDFGTAQGGSDYTYTFVNFQNITIPGYKFEDINGNGTWDGEEGGLEDWTINLAGATTDSTQTDEDGYYEFSNLGPGTYTVFETQEPGWVQTKPSNPDSYSTTAESGVNVENQDFGNFKEGHISGHKFNDEDGNGEWDEGEPALSGWKIWLDRPEGDDIYRTTNSSGYYNFADLGTGEYRVFEEVKDGWVQTAPEELEYIISMTSNGDFDNYDFGNQGQGTITVQKNVDVNGDGDLEDEEDVVGATDWTWDIDGEGDFPTGNTSQEVIAGTHTISEDQKEGYHVTSIECNNEEIYSASESIRAGMEPGQNLVCTFTNTRDTGTIVVHKKVDDGSGNYRTGDSGANEIGFRWTLDEGDEQEMGDGLSTTTGDKHEIDENSIPGYEFTGWYESGLENDFSCTNPESTSRPVTLSVTKSGTRSITLCNQQQNPILTISKINNKTGIDLTPGNDVTYTLAIEATQSAVKNVEVTDLLPSGFKYRGGSWTATLNGAPISIPEPVYASPGVWQVGDMDVNDKVVLSYIADIDSGQQPGLYKDVSWAEGTSLSSSQVLANAIIPGKVDDNFVGTDINVVKETQSGVSVNIETKKTEEVLGASTSLPATGGKTIWMILASFMTTIGFGSLLLGLRLKPKTRRKRA